jgi:hypothetical protein
MQLFENDENRENEARVSTELTEEGDSIALPFRASDGASRVHELIHGFAELGVAL